MPRDLLKSRGDARGPESVERITSRRVIAHDKEIYPGTLGGRDFAGRGERSIYIYTSMSACATTCSGYTER